MSDDITLTETTSQAGVPLETSAAPRTGMLALAACDDPSREGEIAVLRGIAAWIGRDPSLTLLPGGRIEDRLMSRRHAEVQPDRKGGWRIRDGDSRNGTWLNGQRLGHEARPLVDGDLVRAGGVLLVFRHAPMDLLDLPAEADSSLTGRSLAVRAIRDQVGRLAGADLPVLIQGESGTGKELVARDLHRLSRKAGGNFVPVNCAAIPRDLFESTLFGHERGAFTGATERKRGLMEEASGGTLFLDEVAEMPLPAQAKLLRALEEGTILRVGSTRPVAVEIRLVTATRRDLAGAVRDGAFRDDLYARIAQAVVSLPSLAERKEDIPRLVRSFLRKTPLAGRGLAVEDVETLLMHPWHLNTRELRSLMDLVAVEPVPRAGEPLRLGRLARERMARYISLREGEQSDRPSGEAPDEDRLMALLDENGENVSRVARVLGVHRYQVYRWMKRYGIRRGADNDTEG